MLDAFQSLGVQVDLVCGYSAERKARISDIRNNVARGVRYDFVYSESSTMPTIMTDPGHLPVRPLLDYSFFRFCNKQKIPIGLFYRDIYWVFPGYGSGLGWLKRSAAKLAYWYDLWVYNRVLTRLFLPSRQMGDHVPLVDPGKFAALPPGHITPSIRPVGDDSYADDRQLKLFYVGGMSSHYQLHKLFSVVRNMPGVQLTVCTRVDEWKAVRSEYPELSSNIRVIHESGEAMLRELRASDLAVLWVKPSTYWEFASPVKLYEYLGYGKPVLASEGTLAGEFVADHGVGWTIPYEDQALSQLLCHLTSTGDAWKLVRQNLDRVAPMHSWTSRARQVIEELAE
ncbi:hypothetical protein ACJO2E_12545 [Marinobacter sp. M1N3S26]|uniref:hypothetical protein n=1 Tax=Marinobacter sp. M1N3S26 TaxID=3382299 RepID=UPI00387AC8AB